MKRFVSNSTFYQKQIKSINKSVIERSKNQPPLQQQQQNEEQRNAQQIVDEIIIDIFAFRGTLNLNLKFYLQIIMQIMI